MWVLWWDKVVLMQVFSEYFGFPCQSVFHRLLHNRRYLSSGAGTIDQTVTAVPSGLSLTPLRIIIKEIIITSPAELKTTEKTGYNTYRMKSNSMVNRDWNTNQWTEEILDTPRMGAETIYN
jgi:hypothetical protein